MDPPPPVPPRPALLRSTAPAGPAKAPAAGAAAALASAVVAAPQAAGAATVAYGDVALQTYNLPDTQVFAMMGLALFVGVLATRLGASLYK